jgi:hypothetical protein
MCGCYLMTLFLTSDYLDIFLILRPGLAGGKRHHDDLRTRPAWGGACRQRDG